MHENKDPNQTTAPSSEPPPAIRAGLDAAVVAVTSPQAVVIGQLKQPYSIHVKPTAIPKPKMASGRRRVHFVLSTHWDREWYQPFQDFRFRLVQLLDRVIQGFDDGRLKGPFQTDGQAILIEDYLEARPERQALIKRLACEGKLVIGPWYVQPDQFLVSGEALIRNLQLGRQIARALGGQPSHAGFVGDIFGHTSQLPQIFAGFGIKGAFIWRGTNFIDSPLAIWCGADGTEIPVSRFGKYAYCDFAFNVRHMEEPGQVFDPAGAAVDIEADLCAKAAVTPIDAILLYDGADHQEWDERYYAVLAQRMSRRDGPYEIVHSCLDDYLDELLSQKDRITARIEGELREPGQHPKTKDVQWLIQGVLSSRVWMKQENALCQTLLCHWAEPMSALATAMLGREYPQGFLDIAWRWLLQNHAHDSICGCSVDDVHEDMKYRFRQCRQIAERLTIHAMRKLAASVTGEVKKGELRVAVFNALPRSLEQTIELTLEIPVEWPTFSEFPNSSEPRPAFRIFDVLGKELPHQRLAQQVNRIKYRTHDTRGPDERRTHDVRVSLPLCLPAMGYTTLTVRPGEAGGPTRHPAVFSLVRSECSMENEHLRVIIEPNATLTIVDKRTGQTYSRLMSFLENGDVGDGWHHGAAVNDQSFVSTACAADVALIHDGPMLATFRVRLVMRVPREFRFDLMARSEEFVELVIDNLISLRPGQARVEVETKVHNTADDHRLRVLFPSGTRPMTYLADGAFDVIERRIPLHPDNHFYREMELETKPQQSWTAVFEPSRGLAVVSTGLHESAVRDQPDRPLALTLFRGTRRTRYTNGEPGGQVRGALNFRYWIVPLAGEPDRAALTEMGQLLAAGVRCLTLDSSEVAEDGVAERRIPATDGLLTLNGAAVLTSVRRVGQAVEIRVFNPADLAIEAELVLAAAARESLTRWALVDLESNPAGPDVPIVAGCVRLAIGPKKIMSVRLT